MQRIIPRPHKVAEPTVGTCLGLRIVITLAVNILNLFADTLAHVGVKHVVIYSATVVTAAHRRFTSEKAFSRRAKQMNRLNVEVGTERLVPSVSVWCLSKFTSNDSGDARPAPNPFDVGEQETTFRNGSLCSVLLIVANIAPAVSLATGTSRVGQSLP